jgi:hypothetical protein
VTTPAPAVGYGPNLLPGHEKVLVDRAVRPEVARERGYHSVTAAVALRLAGFSKDQQALSPALGIPRFGVDGKLLPMQIRPDKPREDEHGKPAKYECPAGKPMRLDVHPRTLQVLNDPAVPLVICESILKADSVLGTGHHAIGMVGVWGWWGEGPAGSRLAVPCWDCIALADRQIFVAADSDVTSNHMVALAYTRLVRYLDRRDAKVRLVAPLPTPEGKVGVDDFLAKGGDLKALLASEDLADEAARIVRTRFGDITREVAYESWQFWNTSEGVMASSCRGANVARAASQGSFTDSLAAQVYERTERMPSRLGDVLAVVRGEALENAPVEITTRIALVGEELVVDLAGKDAGAVVIGSDGWQVVERSPVPFKRSPKQIGLPRPTRPGSPSAGLQRFRQALNLADEDWPVVLAWLVGAYLCIEEPVLCLIGPEGSGKSVAERHLAGLVDPVASAMGSGEPGVLSIPGDKDWLATAAASYVLAFDNVSGPLAYDLQDRLCRLVTGDGISTRELYTTKDESFVALRRAVMISSIDLGRLRADLAQRVAMVQFQRLQATFDAKTLGINESVRAEALWDLLDLVVTVRRALPHIDRTGLPRVAEFGLVCRAIDKTLGTKAARRFDEMTAASVADAVADDPVVERLIQLLADEGSWTGTPGMLHGLDGPFFPTPSWPKTPEATGRWLKRNTGALRQVGIEAVQHQLRTNKGREWTLTLLPKGERDSSPEPSLQPSPTGDPSELPVLRPSDGSDGCDGLDDEDGWWTDQDTLAMGEENSRQTVTPSQPSRLTPYPGPDSVTVPVTGDGCPRPGEAETANNDLCTACGRPTTADPALVKAGSHVLRAITLAGFCRDCCLLERTPAGFRR